MNLPIYDRLNELTNKKYIYFCMPGHNHLQSKNGYTKEQKIVYNRLKKFEKSFFSLDTTEIEYTDNLADPREVILESEKNIAKIYGAKRAFYLVNGSSVGVLASISTFTSFGEKIIIQDISHKSVHNACEIKQLQKVIINTKYNSTYNYPEKIDLKELEQILISNQEAKAVVITSPSYYGIVQDIKAVAKLVHRYDMKLIVDMAHGAHFVYYDGFPKFAVEQGADVAVCSFHKTLPSINQTALLLANDSLSNEELANLQKSINIYQTTSPSYPMLVNMELVADLLVRYCSKIYKEQEKLVKYFKKSMDFNIYSTKLTILPNDDFTRIVVNFQDFDINFAYEILSKKFKIIPEMISEKNMVFILNIFHTKGDIKRLANALKYICRLEISNEKPDLGAENELYSYIKENIGKKSEKNLFIYPPGSIFIQKGEIIEDKHLTQIKYINSTSPTRIIE
ncbi:aminotransferase class I/II-fold pyridoxal phosphate-dependent enzyme [Criibacterium bergeronii]|uniref:Aminotransferase class I/II-fold pyridoxal phosphate-dependent enzyme n=1 Tax=Criibacterium bergeronii TaxID=1871336 RepID=A0A552VC06_9FIRM|nr:aminotransferase class I/II-fold pyridoxal phosphate-dependent enzyme [Criibacterium bergeronii]TRW28008.1 aminotransferase class I/II-fold pyridoxal phosphate-dependent enzyme [Criibacterium bergeronii]